MATAAARAGRMKLEERMSTRNSAPHIKPVTAGIWVYAAEGDLGAAHLDGGAGAAFQHRLAQPGIHRQHGGHLVKKHQLWH